MHFFWKQLTVSHHPPTSSCLPSLDWARVLDREARYASALWVWLTLEKALYKCYCCYLYYYYYITEKLIIIIRGPEVERIRSLYSDSENSDARNLVKPSTTDVGLRRFPFSTTTTTPAILPPTYLFPSHTHSQRKKSWPSMWWILFSWGSSRTNREKRATTLAASGSVAVVLARETPSLPDSSSRLYLLFIKSRDQQNLLGEFLLFFFSSLIFFCSRQCWCCWRLQLIVWDLCEGFRPLKMLCWHQCSLRFQILSNVFF